MEEMLCPKTKIKRTKIGLSSISFEHLIVTPKASGSRIGDFISYIYFYILEINALMGILYHDNLKLKTPQNIILCSARPL